MCDHDAFVHIARIDYNTEGICMSNFWNPLNMKCEIDFKLCCT